MEITVASSCSELYLIWISGRERIGATSIDSNGSSCT